MALGLIQIAKQTVSSVTEVDFNNVFDATYKQYKIIFNLYSSVETNINIRFIAGGSVDSSTIYNLQNYETGTSISASRSASRTDWASVAWTQSSYAGIGKDFEVLNPYQTMYTTGLGGRSKEPFNQSATNNDVYAYGTNVTTSFDGVRIYGANAFSGTITIYGYRFE